MLQEHDFRQLNRTLNLHRATTWDISTYESGNIKAVPYCTQSLIHPLRSCSECVLETTNNNQNVVARCFTCGCRTFDKMQSRRIIHALFGILGNVVVGETTVYQQLVGDLLHLSALNGYRRQKGTGVVYSQVKPYAYVQYKLPMDYLNELFCGDQRFSSHVKNMDHLVKFMKQYDSTKFPFLNCNKDYIGYSNGVLNKITHVFIPSNEVPKDLVVGEYIDQTRRNVKCGGHVHLNLKTTIQLPYQWTHLLLILSR
jgi:hypothetical protein